MVVTTVLSPAAATQRPQTDAGRTHYGECGQHHARSVELRDRASSTEGRPPATPATGRSPAPDQAPLWQQAEEMFIAWRAGDEGAMHELVGTLTPVLWHVVRAYGLDRNSADDVVQTTWLTLVRSGASIRDERAVLRWLTVAARREAWRVAQAARRTRASDDEVLEAVLPAADSAEVEAVLDDEQRRLWRFVHELSDRCQRLLRVVAFSERPDYAGIADALQMPVGSIGPTRARCLTKLRTLIDTAGGLR